jgi:hypothetical protein
LEHYIGLARAINHGGGLDVKAWAVAVPVARPSLPLSPNRHARPGPSSPEPLAQAPQRGTPMSGQHRYPADPASRPSSTRIRRPRPNVTASPSIKKHMIVVVYYV